MPLEERAGLEEKEPLAMKKRTLSPKVKMRFTEQRVKFKKRKIIGIGGKWYKIKIHRPMTFSGSSYEAKIVDLPDGRKLRYVKYYSHKQKKWMWVLQAEFIPVSDKEAKKLMVSKVMI